MSNNSSKFTLNRSAMEKNPYWHKGAYIPLPGSNQNRNMTKSQKERNKVTSPSKEEAKAKKAKAKAMKAKAKAMKAKAKAMKAKAAKDKAIKVKAAKAKAIKAKAVKAKNTKSKAAKKILEKRLNTKVMRSTRSRRAGKGQFKSNTIKYTAKPLVRSLNENKSDLDKDSLNNGQTSNTKQRNANGTAPSLLPDFIDLADSPSPPLATQHQPLQRAVRRPSILHGGFNGRLQNVSTKPPSVINNNQLPLMPNFGHMPPPLQATKALIPQNLSDLPPPLENCSNKGRPFAMKIDNNSNLNNAAGDINMSFVNIVRQPSVNNPDFANLANSNPISMLRSTPIQQQPLENKTGLGDDAILALRSMQLNKDGRSQKSLQLANGETLTFPAASQAPTAQETYLNLDPKVRELLTGPIDALQNAIFNKPDGSNLATQEPNNQYQANAAVNQPKASYAPTQEANYEYQANAAINQPNVSYPRTQEANYEYQVNAAINQPQVSYPPAQQANYQYQANAAFGQASRSNPLTKEATYQYQANTAVIHPNVNNPPTQEANCQYQVNDAFNKPNGNNQPAQEVEGRNHIISDNQLAAANIINKQLGNQKENVSADKRAMYEAQYDEKQKKGQLAQDELARIQQADLSIRHENLSGTAYSNAEIDSLLKAVWIMISQPHSFTRGLDDKDTWAYIAVLANTSRTTSALKVKWTKTTQNKGAYGHSIACKQKYLIGARKTEHSFSGSYDKLKKFTEGITKKKAAAEELKKQAKEKKEQMDQKMGKLMDLWALDLQYKLSGKHPVSTPNDQQSSGQSNQQSSGQSNQQSTGQSNQQSSGQSNQQSSCQSNVQSDKEHTMNDLRDFLDDVEALKLPSLSTAEFIQVRKATIGVIKGAVLCEFSRLINKNKSTSDEAREGVFNKLLSFIKLYD